MVTDYERAVREHMIDLLFVGTKLVGLIETVDEGDHRSWAASWFT